VLSARGAATQGTPSAGSTASITNLHFPPGRYVSDGDVTISGNASFDHATLTVYGNLTIGGSVFAAPGNNLSMTASRDVLIGGSVIGSGGSLQVNAAMNTLVAGDIVGRDKLVYAAPK